MTSTLRADACVVGAGAGGAVVAAELAEAGMRVVVLEQGPEHDPDGFTARPPQMLARLYRDAGQTLTLGNPPIALPLGRGIGGTTLVNSGTCFRTPAGVLARWQREFGLDLDERAMRPYFERVEAALSVSEVTPALAGENAAVARRGAERLGWSHGYLRRNAKGCVGSGVCAFGCPTSAKQHTGITYVPRHLGRNLSLHPATAAVARMDHVVDMAKGVPQSFYVDEFADVGIMFEGIAGPPSYVAVSLPVTGRRHAEVMASYRRLAQCGLMVSDSSRGRVHVIAGKPLIRYDLGDEDLRRFRVGLARLEQLLRAAGAREVLLPLPAWVRPEHARRRHLKLMAFHPLGTARADARATHGVVDGELRLHGVAGVYVADGSVVPSALGVNPQLTIMALATRLALRLATTQRVEALQPLPG